MFDVMMRKGERIQISQASEGLWSSNDSRDRQACRVTLAPPQLSQAEAEADSAKQTWVQGAPTIPVLSADCCLIGGGTAENESPVLVNVYTTETSMVFAHVCNSKGADPDILETLMEGVEELSHNQIVFTSDQENPVKTVQWEIAQSILLCVGHAAHVSGSARRGPNGGNQSVWVCNQSRSCTERDKRQRRLKRAMRVVTTHPGATSPCVRSIEVTWMHRVACTGMTSSL